MSAIVNKTALAVGVLLLGGFAAAAEPIPAPKSAAPAIILPSPYYRTSQYDVWQYYGVDRHGGFRLRVINAPSGAYYLYNGAPYPWAMMHQRDFMPYVVD